jgi:hypothetical protein
MGTQSHHDDNTARAGCNRKGEWVENSFFKGTHVGAIVLALFGLVVAFPFFRGGGREQVARVKGSHGVVIISTPPRCKAKASQRSRGTTSMADHRWLLVMSPGWTACDKIVECHAAVDIIAPFTGAPVTRTLNSLSGMPNSA